jgi:hypothetical protein
MNCRKILLTPALKREWAEKVQSQFEMSERRACRLVELQRFTKRYKPRPNLENEEITE